MMDRHLETPRSWRIRVPAPGVDASADPPACPRSEQGAALNLRYPFGTTPDAIDGEVHADHRRQGLP